MAPTIINLRVPLVCWSDYYFNLVEQLEKKEYKVLKTVFISWKKPQNILTQFELKKKKLFRLAKIYSPSCKRAFKFISMKGVAGELRCKKRKGIFFKKR